MAEPTPNPDMDAQPLGEPEDNLPPNDVNIEDAGTLRKKVSVKIPRERIDAKLDEMFGELSVSAQVPGFRIGRAPRRLLEKRFGQEVGEDVRNALIGESLGSALDDADLKTMGEPDLNLDDIELPDSGPLEFSFEVEVEPEFDLPETKGIEVNREVFEVTSERIEEYIQNLREGQARYEKTDDPAGEGDAVVASVRITGEDVEWENPRQTLRVAPGTVESLPLVELGDELKGVKPGDTVEMSTTAAESHPNEEWQGKDLTITLTVHEVSKRILPELNEEFATSRGFESVEDMREYVASRLKQRVDQEVQNALRKQICDYLLENTDFELPEGVVARQTQRAMQRQFVELLQSGVPREKIEENLAELQAAAEERATRNLKLSFILGRIADDMNMDVTEGEVNARVAQMAAMYNRRPERLKQELANDGSLEQVGVAIREDKALDALLEEAEIVDVEPSEEDEDKPEAKKKASKKSAKKASKKSSKAEDGDSDKEDSNGKTSNKSAKKKTAKNKASKKSARKKDSE